MAVRRFSVVTDEALFHLRMAKSRHETCRHPCQCAPRRQRRCRNRLTREIVSAVLASSSRSDRDRHAAALTSMIGDLSRVLLDDGVLENCVLQIRQGVLQGPNDWRVSSSILGPADEETR